MIRMAFYVSKEQAEEMIESVDGLDEGEVWEPNLAFRQSDADQIADSLDHQLKIVEE